MTGKKAMYFQSTTGTLKIWLNIMDLSTFSLFSVKFLKDLYLTHCSRQIVRCSLPTALIFQKDLARFGTKIHTWIKILWRRWWSFKINGKVLNRLPKMVVLNSQTSSWKNMLAGDLLGSVLELLLILILTIYLMKKNQYIKISADNTSIFSKVKDKIVSC